jgi:hypothetical protein
MPLQIYLLILCYLYLFQYYWFHNLFVFDMQNEEIMTINKQKDFACYVHPECINNDTITDNIIQENKYTNTYID